MQGRSSAIRLVGIWLAASAATSAGAADTIRCKGALVDVGVTKAEVEAKCGAPDHTEIERVPIRGRSKHGASIELGVATIEHWTYERGPRFPARLTFDEARLKRIEFLTGS